jgi:hypothetical protein
MRWRKVFFETLNGPARCLSPILFFFNAGHIPIRLYVERTTGFPHLHTTDDILELGSCETDAIAILYNKVSNLNALPLALLFPSVFLI